MKKLTSSFAPLALAVLAFASVQADDKDHKHEDHKHEGHAGHMLEGYLAVSDALYKDDLAAAQKAATGMVKHDKDSALAEPATKISEAKDIAGAREAFKTLSATAIKMAAKHGDEKYTVMNCPMVKGGSGDWLSADGKVNNPYFGAKMPHCGGPKK